MLNRLGALDARHVDAILKLFPRLSYYVLSDGSDGCSDGVLQFNVCCWKGWDINRVYTNSPKKSQTVRSSDFRGQ